MRKIIYDNFNTIGCAFHVCSCGEFLSECDCPRGIKRRVIVQNGCARCFERYISSRIALPSLTVVKRRRSVRSTVV